MGLNAKNATAFRRQLAPYIEHARKAGSRQRRRAARPASSRERSGDIRGWAKTRASRSAAAGASPPTLPSSTKPPQEDSEAGLTHHRPASIRRAAAGLGGRATMRGWEGPRPHMHVMPVIFLVISDTLDGLSRL
jgi:Lsr2